MNKPDTESCCICWGAIFAPTNLSYHSEFATWAVACGWAFEMTPEGFKVFCPVCWKEYQKAGLPKPKAKKPASMLDFM